MNILANKYYWSVGFNEVMFGDKEWNITADYSIIDTGTSLSLIPSEDFEFISSMLTNDYEIDVV